MTNEFLLGTALAVPLSVIGNLLSVPLQRWFESRSKRAAERAKRKRKARDEQLTLVKADVFELFAFGFVRLLFIGVVGAVFSVVAQFAYGTSSAVWLLEYFSKGDFHDVGTSDAAMLVQWLAPFIGTVLQVVGMLLVINISLNTVRDIQALRKIDI